MEIKHINPENMAKPRGYSHAISVAGNHRTIYIGGQNAVGENGVLVGKNNLKQQTEQALINIGKILNDADANLENIIKFNIHLLQGQNAREGFQAFQEKWSDKEKFPAVTVLFVAGLGNPDWLVEIDAIAVVQV
jgi:enamine deaminase RidA (YjgF/YER057c/UK114 family)